MNSVEREVIRRNLQYLCEQYGSISKASDVFGINRQQLNKYLSGSSFPSLSTLAKITKANAIFIDDLMLEDDAFIARVRAGKIRVGILPDAGLETIEKLITYSKSTSASLNDLTGQYLVVNESELLKGKLAVSYGKLFQRDDLTFFKVLVPRLSTKSRSGKYSVYGIEALVLDLGGVLHFLRVLDPGSSTAEFGLKFLLPTISQGQPHWFGQIITTERIRRRGRLDTDVMMKKVDHSEPALSVVRRFCGFFDLDDPRLDPLSYSFFRDKLRR